VPSRMGGMLYVLLGLIMMVIVGLLLGGESYQNARSRPAAPALESKLPAQLPESKLPAQVRESKPPAQVRRSSVKRPLRFRSLRTAWSLVCFVACYLLSATWAMTFLPGRTQIPETVWRVHQPYACAILAAAVLGIMPWTGWRFRLIATTLVAAVLGLAVYAARDGFPAIHY
jgi:hypothetical protein